MTRLPFNRLMLSTAMISALAMTGGCGVDDADTKHASTVTYGANAGGPGCDILDTVTGTCALIVSVPDYFVPGVHPRFNPAASDLPLNTDILFSGTVDGTAYVANPDGAANPVLSAINLLDGWSTSAAFDIALSGSIDPTSVNDGSNPATAAMQNVFLVPIESDGDALDPGNIKAPPATFDSTKVAAMKFVAQTVSLDGGSNNVLRIAPTTPLLPKKKYLVVLLNTIKDADGNAITRSAAYDVLGSDDPLASAALLPVRDAVQGWEALAVGFIKARNAMLNSGYSLTLPVDDAALRSSLTLTYTFTTTDPVGPLVAMAAPRAALVRAQQAYGIGDAEAIANVVSTLTADGVTLSTPAARDVAVSPVTGTVLSAFNTALDSGAKLYTGTIALPYYQAAPASVADFSHLATSWTPDTALGGSTAGAALASALGLPVLPLPDGNNPSVTTDSGQANVTYRYPFAGKTTDLKVPLQVTLPDAAYTPAGAPANCGTLYGGVVGTGYPVAIYVHGIGSDRTSAVSLANALAKACVATVAIDLPMHGVAPSNAFYAPDPDGAGPAAASTNYGLNIEQNATLATLYPDAVERHFNQVMGATGTPTAMNLAVNSTDGSGSLFINLKNFANSRDNMRQAVMDLLNLNASLASISALNLDGASAATDFDLTKVYVVGASLGGIIGGTFAAVNQLAYAADAKVYQGLALASSPAAPLFAPKLTPVKALAVSGAGSQVSRILENSQYFSPTILGGLAAAGVTQGTSNYEKFMYVIQAAVDGGDIVNFASILNNGTVPVAGFDTDGDGNDNDVLTENGLDVKLLAQRIVGLPSDATELASDLAVLAGIGDTTTDPVSKFIADKVVPNNAHPVALGSAIPAPLAGTDPLTRLLGLSAPATIPNAAEPTGNGLVLSMQIGHHASLLRPNEASTIAPTNGEYLATVEMQTQIASFLNGGLSSNGTFVSVGTAGPALGMPANTAANFVLQP